MSGLDSCEECGVPKVITSEYEWLTNGDIVQKRDQRNRIILTESENLEPLFEGMEKIIGMPIENIVIDCIRRTYRSYCKLFLPENMEELRANPEFWRAAGENFIKLAIPMGVGRFEFVEMRHEGDETDSYTVTVKEPYSLRMCVACHCGASEAIFGRDMGVEYSEVEPDVYRITTFPQEHPEGLKGRMKMVLYNPITGDIQLETCATCGGPRMLSQNKWYLDRGVIMNKSMNRRLVVMGPNQFDPIFKELENELGDTIPQVVIEAQRRFTTTGFFSMDDYANTEEFKAGLAMRGLGNIKELRIKRTGLNMTVDNAVLPLMLVGMMQGIFDAALDVNSLVEWELSEEGNLKIEVKPA